MKFTVLGASGFIGRHLAATLRRSGYEVDTPGRDLDGLYDRPLGHVMYCIGLTADFRSRPFATARAHVSVLTEVLERAQFDSLLYLSSTRVYARSASGAESAPLTVDANDPSDLYNLSKLAGEALCRSCGRPGVRVARLSNVIGDDPQSENFLSALIREACAGRIELRSDPASAKDYILLDDVVALLPRIALEGKDWLYNVASGSNLSHREIVGRLTALTGCTSLVRPDAPRQDFPTIDISRIRAEFGFSPRPALDILPRLLAQCRSRQSVQP